MDVSSHTTLLPTGDVPEWVQLLPAGSFSGVDGRGPYILRNPENVIAASMAAQKLPIDENHSTQRAPALGQPSPAQAWIVALQSRADGIWGQVEWNDGGRALMTQKKYRGLSPVFAHEKDGTVTRIISAALTNSPNLGQLASLNTEQTHTQSGADMDIATLRAALGLPETADEAAVLTAIATQKQTVAAHTATITNLQAATVPLAEFVALQTQVAAGETARRHEKAVAFIDAAIKDGKALGPVRERMIAMHVADPAGAEALVAGLPSLKTAAGGTYVAEHDAGDGDGLTAMDSQVIKKMGLKKEDFLKTKKSMAEGSAA